MAPTGAHALMAALRHAGAEVVFGYPGGAMLPAYDSLVGAGLRHVLVRHEQGAGHMAEGYAQATGRCGVVMATSGPGATNLVTPLADAHLDSVPLVALTGQVASGARGSEAFQETDIVSVSAPVTKHSAAVDHPDDIGPAVAEAFRIATTGRPGPVLLDFPKDVLSALTSGETRAGAKTRPHPPADPPSGDPDQVRRAAEALRRASRPVLYVGGGVRKAGASAELLALAERLGAPVVTTLMARGAFPDSHPNHFGMPGMHGHWTATTAMQRCDLLVSLGARFDDRVTGALDAFAPEAAVAHVDVDPVEIGKNRAPDYPVVGDCKAVLRQLLTALDDAADDEAARGREAWLRTLRGWQREHPLRWEQADDGPLKPQTVLRELDERLRGRGVVVAGVGQHQMWAAQHLTLDEPRGWVTSGGLGTMGFCLPAAIGAKAGRPDEPVVAVDGDGGFLMCVQELATASTEGLPVVAVVLNNSGLGMVRQWQRLFYEGRYSAVDLDPGVPSLVGLAESFGCVGLRCDSPGEIGAVLDKALSVEGAPVVVDCRVDPAEEVYPMVPAGAANDVIIESPEGRP